MTTEVSIDQLQPIDCPHPMYYRLLELWSNITKADHWHSNPHLFQTYTCRFSSYWTFRDGCAQWEGYSVLSLGAFGFLGALCTILTLHQGHFRQLDFLLFRTVALLEMIQMADVTAMTALAYFRCEYYYVCAFVWAHVATTVANICSDAVDLIILYLSIERTVACLLPHYFRALHNLNNYRLVEALCLLFPAIFSTLQAFELTVFYDQTEGRYLEEPSSFSQSDFYGGVVLVNMIRFYCTASLISVATFSSVIGLISVERRRKKLQGTCVKAVREPRRSSDDSMTNSYGRRLFTMMLSTTKLFSSVDSQDGSVPQRIMRKKSTSNARNRRQTELCCLQLCLAVPVVSNLILYASGLTTSHYSFVTGKSVFESNITFEKAMKEIDMAQTFQYLRTSTNISNVLAHALHFYLYLLFSDKVRHGFLRLLRYLIPCRRYRQANRSGIDGDQTTIGLTNANADRLLQEERTQLMEFASKRVERRENGYSNIASTTPLQE